MAYFLWVIQQSRDLEPSRFIVCLAHRVGPVRAWFVGSRNLNSKNLPSCQQREASIYGAIFEDIWSNPAFISRYYALFSLRSCRRVPRSAIQTNFVDNQVVFSTIFKHTKLAFCTCDSNLSFAVTDCRSRNRRLNEICQFSCQLVRKLKRARGQI